MDVQPAPPSPSQSRALDAHRLQTRCRCSRSGQPPEDLAVICEPSNGEMMQLMETMLARQERTTKEFCDLISGRVQKTEQAITLVDSWLSDLQDRYDRRLTELQAQLDNIELLGMTTQDKEARDLLAKLEKTRSKTTQR